jgi:DNA-binding transcriptional ArsR family regulator
MRMEHPLNFSLTNISVIANSASMNLEEMKLKAGAAEALLKAVANRNRLIILCELLRGEVSVARLQQSIHLSQSALSQHLARLRADKLVSTRRESQTIHYTLASNNVRALIDLLYRLYCAPGCDPAPAAKKRRKPT